MTTHQAAPSTRADYGYDAPGIMLGLLLGGGSVLALGCVLAVFLPGDWEYAGVAGVVLGFIPAFFGLLMVIYAFVGKPRTREYILDLTRLSGDESVLDVGAGAGLLLVGAAKRVPRGRVVGIDLWSAKDLSNNFAANTLRNAEIEGVADRIEIQTGDARELAFPDATFDRVVSLLCLHNIEDKADRARACREIARVLKPGGRAVVGDYIPTHACAQEFQDAGLQMIQSKAAFGVALSLMWILVAEKTAEATD